MSTESDEGLHLSVQFLRALQSKDFVSALSIANELERVRPDDPNLPLFREIVDTAVTKFSAGVSRKPKGDTFTTQQALNGKGGQDDDDEEEVDPDESRRAWE
eukprot:PhF_6_TR39550/c0_g1_i2/m.58644